MLQNRITSFGRWWSTQGAQPLCLLHVNVYQPRSQALPSCGGKTLAGAGHVAPRFWVLN